MVKHEYTLVFKGYKLEGRESTFEHESGIYCVYSCVYKAEQNTVILNELLYIGKADDFFERHKNHEGKPTWRAKLKSGEMLCYTRAPLAKASLTICESALIFHYKPICNDTSDVNFHHDTTKISMSGAIGLLEAEITVERTAD